MSLIEDLRKASEWDGPEPERQGEPDSETWAHYVHAMRCRAWLEEAEAMQTELAEVADDAFRQIAYCCPEGDYREGWWDTYAISTAMELGDLLVKLGKWERHPDGFGRRWFYRPIEQAKEAAEGKEG